MNVINMAMKDRFYLKIEDINMSEELLNILTAIHNENSEIYKLLITSYIDENTTFYGSKREEIIREKMELFNKQFDTVKLEIQGV